MITNDRDKRRTEIAKDNDLLRLSLIAVSFGGTPLNNPQDKIVLTRAVSESPDVLEVIAAVSKFTDFKEENDPHGEHDFGMVVVNDTKYFFKIDYYDDKLEMGVDPYEQEPTRVLTIMDSTGL